MNAEWTFPLSAHSCDRDQTAVTEAVRLFRDGEAQLIMKGLVSTATLLKAVLNKQTGVPHAGRILSHISVFESPVDGRLMLMTDPGVNITPSLQRKSDILKNALDVARKLGMKRPRAAILAATEKINYPAMPATLDGDILTKMSKQGEFGDAEVLGPLSLDLAVSKRQRPPSSSTARWPEQRTSLSRRTSRRATFCTNP